MGKRYTYARKMNVAKMKMLRWMSETTRENRIKDEYVRGSIGMARWSLAKGEQIDWDGLGKLWGESNRKL